MKQPPTQPDLPPLPDAEGSPSPELAASLHRLAGALPPIPAGFDEQLLQASQARLKHARTQARFRRFTIRAGALMAAAVAVTVGVIFIRTPTTLPVTGPLAGQSGSLENKLADAGSSQARGMAGKRESAFDRRLGADEADNLATVAGTAKSSTPAATSPAAPVVAELLFKQDARKRDIVDALFLARALKNGPKPEASWDINNDGRIDTLDVDAIAIAAVRLPIPEIPRPAAPSTPSGAGATSGGAL